MELSLDAIIVDRSLNPRKELIEKWIVQLAENINDIEPVTVVAVAGEGNLLADGFHRYYASVRANRTDIPVELRLGTREDARDLAVVLNFRHGQPLTAEDRIEAIKGYKDRHPGMSTDEIAKMLGVSSWTVKESVNLPGRSYRTLSITQERALASSKLPPETKGRLRSAAKEHTFRDAQELEQAIQTLESDRVTETYKERVLEGDAPPLTFTRGTRETPPEPAFTTQQMEEVAAQALADSIAVQFAHYWVALASLRTLDAVEVVDNADRRQLRMLVDNSPGIIDWLERALRLAREKLEIVDTINSVEEQ